MNTLLWIAQFLLAAVFLMSGIMKATQPKEQLADKMHYVADFTEEQVRLIGFLEVLGGIGLLLPTATGILPWLTPLASVGLALAMVGGIVTHIRRGEYPHILVNIALLALAVFVAYGRFVAVPL